MVGSATAPSTSEQTVMPSWLTAMTSDMFSIARRVVRANRLPASARGSIWVRRAETSANSAATKNALPSSRKSASRIAVTLFIGRTVLTGEQPQRRAGRCAARPCG